MTSRKARNRPVAASAQKKGRTAATKPTAPWQPLPGAWCSFYYEGGHGEKYWSGGWHHGVIREVPIKGRHKGWMRIELLTDHYTAEEDPKTGLRTRRTIPHERPWVFGANVNELGDTTYHGLKLLEIVAERAEKKAEAICEKLKPLKMPGGKRSISSPPVSTKKTSISAKPNTRASKMTAVGSRPLKVPELITGVATITREKTLRPLKPKRPPTLPKKPLRAKRTKAA